MKNQFETIRKFMGYLNNPEKDGGFWLPNIQRNFVWKEEQIERLYDSIVREYPIGTLLVWRTDISLKRRKFIDYYTDDLKAIDFYITEDNGIKMLVLDGQQRLQSLFIGLLGSYNKKELYFNIISGKPRAPEDIRYDFHFLDKEKAGFPWVRFKDIVFSDKKVKNIKEGLIEEAKVQISDEEDNQVWENIEQIRNVFCTQENIVYQEVDQIDRSETYNEDDIVEIFIRANSGGTTLSKSDLMFSLLIAGWEDAEDNMISLIDSLNKTGYKFTRDFILKTCLVLLGKGARFNVDKLRDITTRDAVSEQWEKIADSIKDVKDFIYSKTFQKTDKTIPSYLSLIPLIYFRFHFKKDWEKFFADYQNYLVRTSLSGVFGGSPDNLLDKLVANIKKTRDFNIKEIFGIIREDGRNLEISRDTLMGLNYWKKEIHLFFNLWYGFNYQPAFPGNQPQIDHIFPQSQLKKIKEVNHETGKRNIMKYKWPERDQLGNLMLLTASENGAGGKSDELPETWFKDKPKEYLDSHQIPDDPELWKIENFEEFIEARKKKILDKFQYLLLSKD